MKHIIGFWFLYLFIFMALLKSCEPEKKKKNKIYFNKRIDKVLDIVAAFIVSGFYATWFTLITWGLFL